MGALTGLRVLEVAGLAGSYCGKLFADMGADVILIERPGGGVPRRQAPFIDDVPGVERSLAFAYLSTSKRSITLDLESAEGRALFRGLAATASLVIETETPGIMADRGLDYASLSQIAPEVVVTSITPFGQEGPYARYEATDIVLLALGGLLCFGGYADGPPVQAYGNQALAAGSVFGAVASMLALLEAEASGKGQHIDVSIQECVVMALENAPQFYDLEGVVRKRPAGAQRAAGNGLFECRDGWVYLMAGGLGSNEFWQRTINWLLEADLVEAQRLTGEQWLVRDYVASDEAKAIFSQIFSPFARRHTKLELYRGGQRHRVPICPVNTPEDVLASAQLEFREFFTTAEHPLLGGPIRMPGAPYRFSRTAWHLQRSAPQLGEHNAEVYEELGVSREELQILSGIGAI